MTDLKRILSQNKSAVYKVTVVRLEDDCALTVAECDNFNHKEVERRVGCLAPSNNKADYLVEVRINHGEEVIYDVFVNEGELPFLFLDAQYAKEVTSAVKIRFSLIKKLRSLGVTDLELHQLGAMY